MSGKLGAERKLGAELKALRDALQGLCAGLDPDAVPVPEVVDLYDDLVAIEHLAAGAKLRLLRKLAEAPMSFGPGVRSAEEEIARRSGTSVGKARDAISTSRRLQDQPATDEALRAGVLSEDQAKVISDGAGDDGAAERDLLAAAQRADLAELKRRAQEAKARRDRDAAARRERIRRNRCYRRWTDGDGTACLLVKHLPEVLAELDTLVAPYAQAAFDQARKAGDHESYEAYKADGLLAMARATTAAGGACERPKGASRAETKVFVHIDLDTLVNGRLADGSGSICRIDGVGPVDVDWVRSILGESFVVALLEDRQGVRDVVHLGRKVTAHQRSALEARGLRCEVPGCGATHGLEIDHVTGWSLTKTTQLDDLVWLCRHHHDQKTHRGARLTGPPGARTWHPPPPGTPARGAATRTPRTRSGPPPSPPATAGPPGQHFADTG